MLKLFYNHKTVMKLNATILSLYFPSSLWSSNIFNPLVFDFFRWSVYCAFYLVMMVLVLL